MREVRWLDIGQRAFELGLQGYCCAQVIIKIGLEYKDSENEELVRAMRGLCRGLHTQSTCGALSGGACLLALFSAENAPRLVPELSQWFEETFGAVTCADLMGKGGKAPRKCSDITARVCERCFELLEQEGLLDG